MRQRKEPIKIQSDDWDPDEAAWIKPRVSFAASQRVIYHANQVKKNEDISTEEDAAAQVHHMTAVLVDLIDHWTFRDQAKPYESGVERPILDLTEAVLAEQDTTDIEYLFLDGMKAFGFQMNAPTDVITPAAATEGLQPG